MKDSYIKAVLASLVSEVHIDTVLQGLHTTLVRRGHIRLHGVILRGVLRVLESKKARMGVRITVASTLALTAQKETIEKALKIFDVDSYETIIDPTIIGGVMVEHNNTIIDTSFKTRFVKLYRACIQ